MFVAIILAKSTRGTDKIYHYSVPAELQDKIKTGQAVVVPFGRRRDIGYVVGFVDTPEVKQVKDVLRIASELPLFSEQQIELAKWLADYYCSFLATALRCVLPPGGKTKIGTND